MSDEYTVIYLILTSYIPRLLLDVFVVSLLVGIVFNFMKNPARNI